MPIAGIKVLLGGRTDLQLPYETHLISDTKSIMSVLATFRPDVIVTFGEIPTVLNRAPYEIRKRWIHPNQGSTVDDVVRVVESCYAYNLWNPGQNQKDNPLVSVYTPTYNTGDFLRETFQSLRDQTYTNWEWVCVDDASEDGTWERLIQLSKEDPRVRPVRNAQRCGKIGGMKDLATRLSRGEYLVELDHDDMLTDFALDEITKAFRDPEIGFVYSNCASFYENGLFQRFNDEFWGSRYRWTDYRDKKWLECINPDIYDRFGPNWAQQFGAFLTVGPNHVRAFRASELRKLGGYNPNLPVADDWDLYARFFLRSKCLHIDRMLYLYRFLDGYANTTFTRNKSIQDHLDLGRNEYAAEFDAFNRKRLSKDIAKSNERDVALTVAVTAIESRWKSTLPTLLEDLFSQAAGKPVEVVTLLDNRYKNVSEKRNSAIRDAKGRFVAFVEDDDKVAPDYVDSLLKAIGENPDADCIVFDAEVHGYTDKPKICRYGVDHPEGQDIYKYYRLPMHICCWRKAVISKHEFLAHPQEDMEWADRAKNDVKKQVRIEKTLYFYLHDPKKTTQGHAARPPETEKPKSENYSTADVTYVVLDAVGMDLTDRCLKSIRQYSPGSKIVLVANGCTFGQETRDLADKVVDLEKNIGFAAGCNRGAMEVSTKLVCFMNNDAAFVDETPSRLAAAINDKYQVLAPYSDNAKPPQGFIPHEFCPKEDAFPRAVVGLCMMMPLDLFRRVGGFDTRLTMWEDDDLCVKAMAVGAFSKVVGGTWVQHEMHATFKALNMDPQAVLEENGRIFAAKSPKINVVAIAKDEAEAIGGFITQFRGVADKVCILDTGSTDDTAEVAVRHGARVVQSRFGNFALARNLALKLLAEDAAWVIMLDIDERLDPHTLRNLRELVFRTPHDIFLAPLRAINSDGTTREFVAKPFLFRNKMEIRWVFKVHEKLIGSMDQCLLENARIDHILSLHGPVRRSGAEGLYATLGKEEPYFTDSAYRQKMRSDWPILDYDRLEDPRIAKKTIGPLVSVVVPTYKRLDLLKRAVDSALAQDYANLEVVVVGDGCPDLNPSAFAAEPRVRVFNLDKNHGAGGAVPRNFGIALAAGDLIAYLDDDNNFLESNHISSLYTIMKMRGASFAFSSMMVDGKPLIFEKPEFGSIDTSCVLQRKSLILKYGWWKDRTEANYHHDYELFSRWVKGGEIWAATGKATLNYNADTSGQKGFLEAKLEAASK